MLIISLVIMGLKLSSKNSKLWERPEDASFEELIYNLLFPHSASEKCLYSAQSLVQLARTEKGLLYIDPQTIASIPGVGRSRASALIAAIELARRQHTSEWRNDYPFNLEKIARHLQVKLEGLGQEYFYVFSFNQSFGLIQEHALARGGAQSVNIYFRDIVKILLNDRASKALIGHNHPDASAQPSPEDIESMKELGELLNRLGIALMDQYIVGIDGVYSCTKKNFFTFSKAS